MYFIRSLSILFLTVASAFAAAYPPATVTATAASCTSVTVTWSAASGSGNNAPAQYEIYRNNASTLIGTVNVPTLTFADAGAGAYSSHSYGIRTKSAGGDYSTIKWSTAASTASLCPPPGAPVNLVASTPSCTQVSLSWTAPSQTGAGLVGYRIYRNNIYITQVSGVSYSNSGLTQNTSYTYDVSAMDSSGRESTKTRVVVGTPSCQGGGTAGGPPGVANLAMQGPNNVVTWQGTAGVRYQVESSTDFGINWNPVDVPTTSFAVTHARSGQAGVVYRVAWFTNTAEYKNNYALFSSDTTAPTAVSSYDTADLGGGSVLLEWSESADTQSGLKGYLLYRDDKFLAFAPDGFTAYVDANGQGGASTYDIAAMDRAGNTTPKVRSGCSFSLSDNGWFAPACAGGTSVYVTASRSSCSWSVSNPCGWLSVSSGGNGSGWVNITAASNTSGSTRSCTITIAGQSYTVTQAACVCNYTITTSSSPAAGGSTYGGGTVNCGSSVTVNASVNSGYTFANWTEGGNAVSSSASYTFTANGDRNLVANFTAVTCSHTLVPASSSFGNCGGSSSFIVYTGCSRTATPSPGGWITITGGGSGSGDGTVYFSVAANTGAARSGTITISGGGSSQTYTIYQDAAATCSYSMTPNNVYFSSASAPGSSIVNVSGGGCGVTCAWTATALDSWVSVTGGSSGSGSGTVSYSVNSNPSLSVDRVGRIRVVGGTTTNILTINQDRNYAPVANAGASSSASVGAAVAMNASASTDDDGTIVSYSWSYGDGTTGSGVTASHAYSAAGTYSVTVTTTDDLGAASSASKTVTVSSGTQTTPGEFKWANVGYATLSAVPTDVAVDGAGNVVSVGSFMNVLNFGLGDLPFSGGATGDGYIVKLTSQGSPLWAISFGNLQNEDIRGVAVDGANNIIIIGSFYGTVTIGGTTLTATSPGEPDIFVAKLSPGSLGVPGTVLWAKNFGGTYSDIGTAVALDASGNVFIASEFVSSSVTFGAFTVNRGAGGRAAAVVKLSGSTGSVTWARSCPGGTSILANALTVTSAGDPILAGNFLGTVDFGGTLRTSVGGGDMYMVKLAGADGTFLWSKAMGATGDDTISAIVSDPATGNIIISGSYRGTANFGGPITNVFGTLNTMGGLFLASYNSAATYQWAFTPNLPELGVGRDCGYSIAVDESAIYFTGQIEAGVYFTPDSYPGGSGANYFVASTTKSGAYRWAHRSGGSSPSKGSGIALADQGRVVTAGGFTRTTIYFDDVDRVNGGSGTTPATGAPFVVQYSR